MERSDLFMGVMVALAIFLAVLLLVAVAADHKGGMDAWSISSNHSLILSVTVFVGEDGTVYVIDDYRLQAIGRDGKQLWDVRVPALVNSTGFEVTRPIYESVVTRDGYLYVFFRSDEWSQDGVPGEFIAISPEGKLLWCYQYSQIQSAQIEAAGDKIYLLYSDNHHVRYYTYNLTAFDRAGNIEWSNDAVYMRPAFADNGTVYLIVADRIPIYSDLLRAYAPDGALLWERRLSAQGINAPMGVQWHNGSLYVSTYNGCASLDTDGNLKWIVYRPGKIQSDITFDTDDNLYMRVPTGVDIFGKDGREIRSFPLNTTGTSAYLMDFENGMAYFATESQRPAGSDLEDLASVTLTSYSLKNGDQLWVRNITPAQSRIVTLDKDNGNGIIPNWNSGISLSGSADAAYLAEYYGITSLTPRIVNDTYLSLNIADGQVFLSYWADNFEFPAVFGQSKCAYDGGIYAYDTEGKFLWYRPTSAYAEQVTKKNGTIYYSTTDGKLSSATLGLTAGLLASLFYLFLRFALVGAVARARSRLEKNENRNRVHRYVADNPGSRLYDIAKGLDMNVGTLRYHLLILGLNHRVKADDGLVGSGRYYANGRQFTEDEKLVLAFMKRSQVEKLLLALAARPGVPNTVLSSETGLPESAVSRYMRELASHGIVVKQRAEGGRMSYFIDDRYRNAIASYRREA